MLSDQVDFLRTLERPGRSVEVCLDQPGPSPALPWTFQGRGDLGRRMSHAFDRAFAAGSARVLILGTEAPTLPRSLVEESPARVANGAAASIVPALGGGYVAIALAERAPHLFDRIPWGTSEVLATTWARATSKKMRLDLTGTWGDVDEASDLKRLAVECEADPARAPRTAAVLNR